jgi:hypothetical protein
LDAVVIGRGSHGCQRQESIRGSGSVAAVLCSVLTGLVGVQHNCGEEEAAIGILAALDEHAGASEYGIAGGDSGGGQSLKNVASWTNPRGRDWEQCAARLRYSRRRRAHRRASSRVLR